MKDSVFKSITPLLSSFCSNWRFIREQRKNDSRFPETFSCWTKQIKSHWKLHDPCLISISSFRQGNKREWCSYSLARGFYYWITTSCKSRTECWLWADGEVVKRCKHVYKLELKGLLRCSSNIVWLLMFHWRHNNNCHSGTVFVLSCIEIAKQLCLLMSRNINGKRNKLDILRE